MRLCENSRKIDLGIKKTFQPSLMYCGLCGKTSWIARQNNTCIINFFFKKKNLKPSVMYYEAKYKRFAQLFF